MPGKGDSGPWGHVGVVDGERGDDRGRRTCGWDDDQAVHSRADVAGTGIAREREGGAAQAGEDRVIRPLGKGSGKGARILDGSGSAADGIVHRAGGGVGVAIDDHLETGRVGGGKAADGDRLAAVQAIPALHHHAVLSAGAPPVVVIPGIPDGGGELGPGVGSTVIAQDEVAEVQADSAIVGRVVPSGRRGVDNRADRTAGHAGHGGGAIVKCDVDLRRR